MTETRYEERQTSLIMDILPVSAAAVVAAAVVFFHEEPHPWEILASIAAVIVVFILFGELTLRVTDSSLEVWFGLLRWHVIRIPLVSLRSSRVVTYRPLREFGGWGIRWGRFEGQLTGAYSLSGDRGVLLELSGEQRVFFRRYRRLLIGSRDPEALEAALRKNRT